MPKKSREKFKYLLNEKSFQDEIKSIFHHFWMAIIEAKKNFLEGESPTLRSQSDFKTLATIIVNINSSKKKRWDWKL